MSSNIASTGTSAATTSTSSSTPSVSSLITSTGIGSGLDISGIVSALTSSFGAATSAQLDSQQSTLDSQVSAYGTFTSAVDTLQSSLSALETPSQLAGFDATVADKTIATATTASSAVAGQYQLLVTQLATPDTLTSAPIGATTAVGTGTLTLSVGGASSNINIDSSNNTLAGIASAINGAADNPGVTANVITTTEGSRLILTGSATGAASAISVTQTGGDAGLTSLVSNLTDTPAQDAQFSINGFAATSSNNLVSGAITGVTINLLQVSPTATPTTLSVTPDTTTAQSSVDNFVTALNATISAIQSLTAYDPSTQTAGALNGDPTLESFQNQLENILDTVKTGGTTGINSLADIGITANTDGSYSSDDTKLGNALTASLAGVSQLLGGTNGIASQLDKMITSYTGAGGLLSSINTGLQSSLKSVASQQAALTAQLSAYSATLTIEYNAMDTAVAKLKETQQYLTAEFNASSASSSSSSTSSLSSGTVST